MGSSQSINSGGSVWTNEIYFDPRSDCPPTEGYYIKDTDLRVTLSTFIDEDEDIEDIWLHSHRLFSLQLYEGIFLYHAFVIIKTNYWFWSVEKSSEGITIQRSERLSFVKYQYRRNARITPITERTHDSGRMRMEDLVKWIFETDEHKQGYCFNFQALNCQGFAKRIFNHFASTKVCDPFTLT